MVKSVTFEVIGDQRLACENCERRVERLLKGVQGVTQVRAEARSQRVDVLIETASVDATGIADRLREAGYETSVVAATPDND